MTLDTVTLEKREQMPERNGNKRLMLTTGYKVCVRWIVDQAELKARI